MHKDSAKLWWEEITGPANFVRDVVVALEKGMSPILMIPSYLPWVNQMMSSIEQMMHDCDPELQFDHLCGEDENVPEQKNPTDIGHLLLERYATPKIQSGYRQTSGQSIQQYLVHNHVLAYRVLWIRQLPYHQTKRWIDFCKNYPSNQRYDGLFIVEVNEDQWQGKITSGQLFLKYAQYTTYYDCLLFNNMLCATQNQSIEWKQYASTVATQLCNENVMLSEELLQRCDFMSESPLAQLAQCAVDPLLYDHATLEYALWKAQLQVLFALIESERIACIVQNQTLIEEAMGVLYWDRNHNQSRVITQYGEAITNAFDVELGTLHRMTCCRRASDLTLYVLFLSQEEDRNRIALLHEMRNGLAHRKPCSPEQVFAFLSHYPYVWGNREYSKE